MKIVFRAYLMNIYDFLFNLFVENEWVQISLHFGGVVQHLLLFCGIEVKVSIMIAELQTLFFHAVEY